MTMRVDFKDGSFDALIDRHGLILQHYHAIPCPCRRTDSGNPNPNCQYCYGRGWQYYGQDEIRGVVQSISAEKQYGDSGGYLIGTMTLTTKADVELSYHDRIINVNSVMPFSELIIRGEDTTDKGRFPIIKMMHAIGPNGTIYNEGIDFTLENNRISWIEGGSAPAEESYYSVAYKTNPSWLCLQPIHLIRDTNIKFRQPTEKHKRLPIQMLCRLEYLMED